MSDRLIGHRAPDSAPVIRIINTNSRSKTTRADYLWSRSRRVDSDCVNCGRPDAERVTLSLDGGETLSEVRLCAECLSVFETTEWIQIEESLAAE